MLGRIAADRERRVVLVLDEFQEVVDIDPALHQADALGLPGAARGRAHLPRQQAPHDAPDLQRRERAVLAQREADGAGRDPAGSLRAVRAGRFEETGKQLRSRACARALELTGGHPTPRRSSSTSSGRTPAGEAAIRALDARSTRRCAREHSHFSLIWDGRRAAQKRVLAGARRDQPGRPLAPTISAGTRSRDAAPSRRR